MIIHIETLNHWGGTFEHFAWAMLWQSSALMAVVWVFDLLLARKIRAAVRYALWLTVLVKLVLPPALALPTGAAWWLIPVKSAAPVPVVKQYEVSYGGPVMSYATATVALPPPVTPALSVAGWMLWLTVAGSAVLFLWLVIRWWQVGRLVRGAEEPAEMSGRLHAVQKRLGWRTAARLKVVDDRMSPALCGLWRPVILLPRTLAERLSPRQLEVVLLHELIHLRRRDTWINFAQTLLQILYWWHPLLWLANARIRQVREQAVDDAVMVVLEAEADEYAPTLLEVAKMTFRRPLIHLGLVGIMESRSALRRRIERLMNFAVPRRAGLTFTSLCCICAFGAVALPMGEAPAKSDDSFAAVSGDTQEQALALKVNPKVFLKNAKAYAARSFDAAMVKDDCWLDIMRSEGVDFDPPHAIVFNSATGEISTRNTPEQLELFRQVVEQLNRPDGQCELPLRHASFQRKSVLIQADFYHMAAKDFGNLTRSGSFSGDQDVKSVTELLSPERFNLLQKRLAESGMVPFSRPRVETGHGIPAELYAGNDANHVEFDCRPFLVDHKTVELTFRAKAGQAPAGGAASALGQTNWEVSGKAVLEDGGGLVVCADRAEEAINTNLVMVLRLQIVTNRRPAVATSTFPLALTNTAQPPLATVIGILSDTNFDKKLHALERQTGIETLPAPAVVTRRPPGLNQVGDGVLKEIKTPYSADISATRNQQLITRVFRLNLSEDMPKVEQQLAAWNVVAPAAIFSNGLGYFMARGSAEQLDVVERAVMVLNGFPTNRLSNFAEEAAVAKTDGKTTKLYERVFRLDPLLLRSNLRSAATDADWSDGSTTKAFRALFVKLGIDFDTVPGKSCFCNTTKGLLFVKATETDLDTVEKALQVMNQAIPQVHIKARFIEVPAAALADFPANGLDRKKGGVLPAGEARAAWKYLESLPAAEVLAEPEVTTTTGRQTQVHAITVTQVETNSCFIEHATNNDNQDAVEVQTGKFETGPTFEVVPYVLSDGYTLNLYAQASVLNFIGYADSTNLPPVTFTNSLGEVGALPIILPDLALSQATAVVNLYDNQTLVLFPKTEQLILAKRNPAREARVAEHYAAWSKSRGDKVLIVLMTATIIDAAGNRVHTEAEMPFAQNQIPQQPGI